MPPIEECYSSDETSEDNCVGTVVLDSLKEGRKRDCFARKISSERKCLASSNVEEYSSGETEEDCQPSPVLTENAKRGKATRKLEKAKRGSERYYESELDRTIRIMRAKEYNHHRYKLKKKQKVNELSGVISKAKGNVSAESMSTSGDSSLLSKSTSRTTTSRNCQLIQNRNPTPKKFSIWEFDDGTVVKKCV